MKHAEMIAARPALLTIKAAAIYAACSAGYLDKLRSADVKRRAAGLPIEGPEWVRMPHGIRYAREALDAWIARSGVVGGVMESRKRSPRPVRGLE